MTKKLELIIKFDTDEQVSDILEIVAIQLRNAGVERAPCDIREYEDGSGFYYDVYENDGTDIYGNEIGAKK